MAVDISNGIQTGSKDPHALLRVNTTNTRDAYLPAGANDWSSFALDTPNPEQGLTKPIKVAQGILNNGDTIWVALDEKNQPIWTTSLGDVTGTDDKQAQTWRETGPKSQPPGATPTQNRKGPDGLDHIYQYNPATGLYDQDLGALQGVGPPGGKPYIDDGAEAGQSGRRWGWNQQTHAYDRDLGPSPAAQQPTTAKVSVPDNAHPGLNIVTTEDPTTKVKETHYENAQGQTVPTPPDAPTVSLTRETRNGKVYTVVTSVPKAGGTPTISVLGSDGQPVPGGLPDEGPKDTPTVVQGSDGKTYIRHTVLKPDGSTEVYHTDQAGNRTTFPDDATKTAGQLPTSLQGWRPDPNKPGWGMFDRRDQLMAAVAQGAKKPDGTPFTAQDVVAVLGVETELTKTAASQQVQQQTEQRSLRTEAMTQRGQDINLQSGLRTNVGNMVSQATTSAAPFVGKVAPPPGGSITGSILQGQYAIGRAMGAYDTPPDVPLPAFAQPYGQASTAAAATIPTATQLTGQTDAATAEAERQRQLGLARKTEVNPPPGAPSPSAQPSAAGPAAAAATTPALTPPPLSGPLIGPSSVPPHTSATDTRLAPQPGQVSPDGVYSRVAVDGSTLIYTPDGKVSSIGEDGVPGQVGTWDPTGGPPPYSPAAPDKAQVFSPSPSRSAPDFGSQGGGGGFGPQPGDQPNGSSFEPGAPVIPPNEVTQGQPQLPAFANAMLSPRAILQAKGYRPEVIDEALRRAGIAA